MKILALVVLMYYCCLFVLQIGIFKPGTKFKSGNCVNNQQFNQTKMIISANHFRYNYCIFNKIDCVGNYYLRKDWFDRNHKLVKCHNLQHNPWLFLENLLGLLLQ